MPFDGLGFDMISERIMSPKRYTQTSKRSGLTLLRDYQTGYLQSKTSLRAQRISRSPELLRLLID
jgi:hypothetical protein